MNIQGIYRVPSDDISMSSATNKCIVLDLDQTLVASQESMSSLQQLGILSNPYLLELRNRTYHIIMENLEKPGIGSRYDMWGVTRPHLKEFLFFCFSYFKIVAIWTAGKKPYAEAIVNYIFKDLPKPHIIFTSNDTLFSNNGIITKPLTKMISFNPMTKRYMSLDNTLVLDDNISTFSQNVGNGILIPPYEPDANIDSLSKDDQCLLQLMQWLLQPDVMAAADVTKLDKNRIFHRPINNFTFPLRKYSQ